MIDINGISRFNDTVNVSRETIERLKLYEALLKKWNPTINLVSRGTLGDIWNRHFLDSAQIWTRRPPAVKSWLDLGSGAGFPGLVIAVLAAEQDPALEIRLVESDHRKSAFLLKASQEMGISTVILTERIEVLIKQNAEVISARALAPLPKLLEFAERHGSKSAICLFSKGKNAESELTEAQKYWTFAVQKTPSLTDPDGEILEIGGFGRV